MTMAAVRTRRDEDMSKWARPAFARSYQPYTACWTAGQAPALSGRIACARKARTLSTGHRKGVGAVSAYLPILTMILLVLLFAALSFVASGLLGPRRPTSAKEAPYECGIVPETEPAERFPVKFYL